MGNSTLNSARELLERTNTTETSRIINEKVNKVTTSLVRMGVSDNYIHSVLERLSTFNNAHELDEAINRELYKASQFSLFEGDEEDSQGKGSEDAEGKGAKFARPVKTKGDAKKTLKDKQKGKEEKMEHLEALFSGEELTDAFKLVMFL